MPLTRRKFIENAGKKVADIAAKGSVVGVLAKRVAKETKRRVKSTLRKDGKEASKLARRVKNRQKLLDALGIKKRITH